MCRIQLAVLISASSMLCDVCDAVPPPAQPDGWSVHSPRPEIAPAFDFVPDGGPQKSGALVIDGAGFEGSHGWWETSVPVTAGKTYRFQTFRRTTGVDVPRRSGVVRIEWRKSTWSAACTGQSLATSRQNFSATAR